MENTSKFSLIRIWAEQKGIYSKGDIKTQFLKLIDEEGELARAILKNDKLEIKDGIGDMIVVLTSIAHFADLKIEDCIDHAWNEIKDRTGKMIDGDFVKDPTCEICKGEGYKNHIIGRKVTQEKCINCNGKGQIININIVEQKKCKACNGSGMSADLESILGACGVCFGTGKIN